MIRLRPRASDGVAEPRLRSLDPGRASERLLPAARLPCSFWQRCGFFYTARRCLCPGASGKQGILIFVFVHQRSR